MRARTTGTSTINPWISSNPSSAAQARQSQSRAVPPQWLPVLLASGVVPPPLPPPPPSPPMPPPPYYTLMGDALSWTDADAACQAAGLQLASVQSAAQNALLVAAAAGNEVWIGGTDAASEGTWVWSPFNTPLSYTNWYPGEPNNSGGAEDCLHFNTHNAPGKWNDKNCTRTMKYVCQTACPVPPPSPPPPPPPLPPPAGPHVCRWLDKQVHRKKSGEAWEFTATFHDHSVSTRAVFSGKVK